MNKTLKMVLSSSLLLLLVGGLGFTLYQTNYRNKSQDIRSRAANEPTIFKFVGNQSESVGTAFTISVIAEAAPDGIAPKLSATEIDVTFPKDKLRLTNIGPIAQGPLPVALPFLISSSSSPVTHFADNGNGTGKIIVAASCNQSGCQTSSAGFLATFYFEAIAPGQAIISFDQAKTSVAAVGTSGPLPIRFETFTVNIANESNIPVTSTQTESTTTQPTATTAPIIPTATTAPPIATNPTPTDSIVHIPAPTTCEPQYTCTDACAQSSDPNILRACANPDPYQRFPEYAHCFVQTTTCN